MSWWMFIKCLKMIFLNSTLYAANAAAEDWDINISVAWAPDYEDPSTYLDIFKTTASENTKTYMGFDDPNKMQQQLK